MRFRFEKLYCRRVTSWQSRCIMSDDEATLATVATNSSAVSSYKPWSLVSWPPTFSSPLQHCTRSLTINWLSPFIILQKSINKEKAAALAKMDTLDEDTASETSNLGTVDEDKKDTLDDKGIALLQQENLSLRKENDRLREEMDTVQNLLSVEKKLRIVLEEKLATLKKKLIADIASV